MTPVRVATADPPQSPSILLCHINPLHVHLHHIHEPSPFPSSWQLHLQHASFISETVQVLTKC